MVSANSALFIREIQNCKFCNKYEKLKLLVSRFSTPSFKPRCLWAQVCFFCLVSKFLQCLGQMRSRKTHLQLPMKGEKTGMKTWKMWYQINLVLGNTKETGFCLCEKQQRVTVSSVPELDTFRPVLYIVYLKFVNETFSNFLVNKKFSSWMSQIKMRWVQSGENTKY